MDPKHADVALADADSNTKWSSAGVAVDGPKETQEEKIEAVLAAVRDIVKHRFICEQSGMLVRCQETVDLLAQDIVSGAGCRDECGPIARVALERRIEDGVQPPPLVGRDLRGTHA